MKNHDIVAATFQPARTDNLIPGAEKWIGHRCNWRASGTVEDGPYAGDFMMMPVGDIPPIVWVPQRDLADIVHISSVGRDA